MKLHKNIVVRYTCVAFFIFQAENIDAVLTVSQYKPDSLFQTANIEQDYYAQMTANISGGYASQAFNSQGDKVPFFQQFGQEDLLKKFVDKTLPITNLDSWGKGLLSGEFHFRELIIDAYKNINHGFFIQAATAIQDLAVQNISVGFALSEQTLSQQQKDYLVALQQALPYSITRSGMFTTAVSSGYNRSFTNFKTLDFIDLMIKTGFLSPQAMTQSATPLLQAPFNGNHNFGYPLTAVSSLGLLDWMTIGVSLSTILWQPCLQYRYLNTAGTKNALLLTDQELGIFYKGTRFATSLYLQADHIYHGFSVLAAYNYTANLHNRFEPIGKTYSILATPSQPGLLDPWSLGSLYLQVDFDWATLYHPSAPIIRFFCDIPLAGSLCPATNVFGGSCNLQVSYAF